MASERVQVFEDSEADSASDVSYFSDASPPRQRRRPRRTQHLNPGYIRVDGKVPPVVHTVEYVGRRNRIFALRQSTKPFNRILESKVLANDQPHVGQGDGENAELEQRPIIEITTHVNSRRDRGHIRSYRRRDRVIRQPVTAAFGNARDYVSGSESEVDDVVSPFVVMRDAEMTIWSEHLKNALKAVVAYYPFFKLSEETLKIPSPYHILYHHRQELSTYRNNQPETHSAEYAATTSAHIDVLLDFLETNQCSGVRKEEELHKLDVPLATFKYFWLLLKPGSVVYAKRYNIWTPYIVSNIISGGDGQSIKVNGWLLESGGARVERFMESFTVPPWLGEQAISTLPVVPAAYWKDDLEAQNGLPMYEKCVAEGKMYWDLLQGPKYMQYDGHLVESGDRGRHAGGPCGFMSSRVVCDIAGLEKFMNMGPPSLDFAPPSPRRERPVRPPPKDHLPKSRPRCTCDNCADLRPAGENYSPWFGYEDLDPTRDTPPDDDLFYVLLSNTVPGFILGSRRWGHLNIAHLKPVETDKNAFNSLMIDEDIKVTVKALIGQFAANADGMIKPWGNDFIKHKGDGRIFLFHGEPGVGKTCTAECIAELTGRPLLSLTAGDLGIDSWRVEQNLNYFLDLGQRYGALVLLDEADVYLERRRARDIDRNGLVSVFLRALEYYRGCIIISTNRVRAFDKAFMSRIHVALHYKNLRNEDRERIWDNNFERLKRDSGGKVHVSVAAKDYIWESRDVRDLTWNGREIRNAMQTALALAEAESAEEGLDKITITEKHVRAVVKLSASFKDFIRDSMPDDTMSS
ncbi:uncharacterized protein F5Z01DRAFT_619132 [Emericellopsis atlantica]|uniref:AAA+ ATPase domain-containing protein n=1 Tax=Emericellopsis atlantica TaxID=2614577 RepID=A0A9P7ZPU0_9HYPO|nr:uncharacterized protein F5Z01DRAFT_619132 [Emericellopsis atlantica]KAG9255955.1 hypothetical protein F5Z01DRAFT_619132 [Emericellopsis atlantica]